MGNNIRLFSKVVTLVYTPISNVQWPWESSSAFHISQNFKYLLVECCYIVVLTCISVITNDMVTSAYDIIVYVHEMSSHIFGSLFSWVVCAIIDYRNSLGIVDNCFIGWMDGE